MELPGHVNCQGSGPGQWILGGGGNSVGRGPKTVETVCQGLAFTMVMVRSGFGNVGDDLPNAGGWSAGPTVRAHGVPFLYFPLLSFPFLSFAAAHPSASIVLAFRNSSSRFLDL